ncbi:MAG: YolD-like family protein [Anaeroplasmataceae bacterium]|nr:YolD-like family protein [Anaeroplasmataceae bacterium]
MAEKSRKNQYLSIDTKNKMLLEEKFPIISETEKLSMNDILYECYSQNKAITISYFENGTFHHYSGVIAKIGIKWANHIIT